MSRLLDERDTMLALLILLTAFVLLAMIIAARRRVRKLTHAELRALKELSAVSGLMFRRANLFRPPRLIGKWHGRAMDVALEHGGLRIRFSLPDRPPGRLVVRYPAERGSPTWGVSRHLESTYHLAGDMALIRSLAAEASCIDAVRHLAGEFELQIRPRRRRGGRLVFHTAIAIASAEQLRRLLDALQSVGKRGHSTFPAEK